MRSSARRRGIALLLLAGFAGTAWAQTPGPNNAITDAPGISVGHHAGSDAGTTVVLAGGPAGQGVTAGIVTRGGSPGTRETCVLSPVNRNEAVLLRAVPGPLHGRQALKS